MKKFSVKRIIALFICTIIMLSFIVVCYAEEPTSESDTAMAINSITIPASPNGFTVMEYALNAEDNSISLTDFHTVPSLSTSSIGYIQLSPGSNNDLWILLSSWGITKRFVASSTSNCTMGALWLFLYDPNGNLKSDDWAMSTDENAYWDIWWPQTGTWKLTIVAAGTDGTCDFFAGWN